MRPTPRHVLASGLPDEPPSPFTVVWSGFIAATWPVSVPIFTVGVLHAIAEIPDSKGGK